MHPPTHNFCEWSGHMRVAHTRVARCDVMLCRQLAIFHFDTCPFGLAAISPAILVAALKDTEVMSRVEILAVTSEHKFAL
eukprot:SAG11_NODE_111_length_16190_cov_9.912808_2_plen_80_part_00